MKILVSKCLTGVPCRYDGHSCCSKEVCSLMEQHEILPVCPEMEAGLGCPRKPFELVNEKALTKDGQDITDQLQQGVDACLQKVHEFRPDLAVLKSRSPSCGCGSIYDGTFSGTLIEGDGIFAKALKSKGLRVVDDQTLLSCTLNGNGLKLEMLKDLGGKF